MSDGCPAERVYWWDPSMMASIAASRTNWGGSQFGKPCPRFTPLVCAASAPNSPQTVGPFRPASFLAMTLIFSPPTGAGGRSAGGRSSRIEPRRIFSSTIIAPSRRRRASVVDSSSMSLSSSFTMKSLPPGRNPPSKTVSVSSAMSLKSGAAAPPSSIRTPKTGPRLGRLKLHITGARLPKPARAADGRKAADGDVSPARISATASAVVRIILTICQE
mmetsp:Transcript_7931/g.19298  ORF Transcript_7931/g.19298 Transcript_7931/m.19298 type:complete len:218 (-) Transcript_7931:42-695(-)